MFTVHVVEEMRNSPYVVAVIMSLIYSRMRQFDRATASLPGPGCWMMAGIGAAQDRSDGLLARLAATASASASADNKVHQVYFLVSDISPQSQVCGVA